MGAPEQFHPLQDAAAVVSRALLEAAVGEALQALQDLAAALAADVAVAA